MSLTAGQLVTETLEYDGGRRVTVYVPPSAESIVFARGRSHDAHPSHVEGGIRVRRSSEVQIRTFWAVRAAAIGTLRPDQP